jgi:hypothetical protein
VGIAMKNGIFLWCAIVLGCYFGNVMNAADNGAMPQGIHQKEEKQKERQQIQKKADQGEMRFQIRQQQQKERLLVLAQKRKAQQQPHNQYPLVGDL